MITNLVFVCFSCFCAPIDSQLDARRREQRERGAVWGFLTEHILSGVVFD
jgi:hypothetical protein